MPKMPKIPLDFMAVLQEAIDVEAARNVPLCVSVMLDETAPADVVAFVRSSFASASPQARVSVNYFQDGAAMFDPRSDMAVIAAGITAEVGEIAQRLRDAGIPALVVTTLPHLVRQTAEERGFPIPDGDIVAPTVEDGSIVALPVPVVVRSEDEACVEPPFDETDPFSLEPFALNEEYTADLRRRMGEWVVAAFREKRLAFAQAFDFVRKPLSVESVRATSMQNAGVGLVVFIPGADMPIMTLNQAKMVLQIAAAYGQPLSTERVKELAAVVGGGFACRSVARQIVGVVPAIGWAVKAGIGFAGTQAMGHAAIEYFEHGGDMAGIAGVVSEARAKAAEVVDNTAAGRTVKEVARQMGNQAKAAAADRAKSAVKAAPSTMAQFVRTTAETTVAAAKQSRRK